MVRSGVYHTGVTQQSELGKVDVGKGSLAILT